jgi:hypothetical protein
MNATKSLASGLVGAAALTGLHETARRLVPFAPRVDVVGERAVRRSALALGYSIPRPRTQYWLAMAGDLLSNAFYYSLISAGRARHPWMRATGLGVIAGISALALPPALGLGRKPVMRTNATAAMTVGWYIVGALATAAAARVVQRATDRL